MFKKFEKIPGESAVERYNRFVEHQRKAAIYGWEVDRDRKNAERASKTNFTDLFSEEDNTPTITPTDNTSKA